MLSHTILPFKLIFSDRSVSIDVAFFSLLLILIPIVLITGPALPDIFISLIALYFLIKSVIKKNWHYYKNPIVIGFLLFSFYGISRSLFSEIPLESLTNEGSVFYFRYIFFAMGVWYLLDKNPYLMKCLVIILFLCVTLVSIDALYQYFLDVNIFGNEKYSHNRLTGLLGEEPIIGRYISYLSIFTFALIYHNYKKSKKMIIFSISFLVMCEVIIFLTGERAPLFYISFFSVLIVIFIPHYRIYRIIGVLASVVIILGILEVNSSAKTRMIDNTLEQMSKTHFPFLPYTSHHEEHYISSLKMFNENPLFGVGTNMFEFYCAEPQFIFNRSCASHPHNFYFQLLAELGIVGFLFISTFFCYLLFVGLKQFIFIIQSNKKRQISFEIFLYPMIIFVYWWPLIPHMSFYNNWNNVFIMLPLGFFMKFFYGNTKKWISS